MSQYFSVELMLIITVLITLFMVILGLAIHLTEPESRRLSSMQFWLSTLIYFFCSMLANGYGYKAVAFTLLFLNWNIYTIRLILQEFSKAELKRPWQTQLMGLSSVWLIIFLVLDQSFEVITIPIMFSFCSIGLYYVYLAWKEYRRHEKSAAHYLMLANFLLTFLWSYQYPFLRFRPEFNVIAYVIGMFTILFMAILVPMVTVEELKDEQEKGLAALLKNLSEQLNLRNTVSTVGALTQGLVGSVHQPLERIRERVGQVQLLLQQEDKSREEIIHGMEQVEETAQKTFKMIRALQTSSRMLSEKTVVNANIKELIEDTLSFCEARLLEYGITLKVENCADLNLLCNPSKLSHVLLNLLNNSIDAIQGRPDPWITLSCLITPSHLEIKVVDSGPFISPQIRKRMTEPFFTTKPFGQGAGLGLTISQQIIKEQQGEFFHDETTAHTTFVIRLPIKGDV